MYFYFDFRFILLLSHVIEDVFKDYLRDVYLFNVILVNTHGLCLFSIHHIVERRMLKNSVDLEFEIVIQTIDRDVLRDKNLRVMSSVLIMY